MCIYEQETFLRFNRDNIFLSQCLFLHCSTNTWVITVNILSISDVSIDTIIVFQNLKMVPLTEPGLAVSSHKHALALQYRKSHLLYVLMWSNFQVSVTWSLSLKVCFLQYTGLLNVYLSWTKLNRLLLKFLYKLECKAIIGWQHPKQHWLGV